MIKVRLNRITSYLLLFLIAVVIVMVDMSSTLKWILIVVYFISTAPVFYYYYIMKLVQFSSEMQENSPEYYKSNVSKKSYKSVKIVYVPFFEFVNDVKKTNNQKGIQLAKELMSLAGYAWFTFLLSIGMFIFQTELLQ